MYKLMSTQQVMTVPTAIRVKNALSGITAVHLARNIADSEPTDYTMYYQLV